MSKQEGPTAEEIFFGIILVIGSILTLGGLWFIYALIKFAVKHSNLPGQEMFIRVAIL